ncbi:hypothetical protein CGRA01v4_01070 [Colletotrichum graminicola]|nr:hypothetical protein CGRA01v4_01070 [Colletotrichum graminicola]
MIHAKNKTEKKLWHLRCSSLSLTVSSLFWSMLSIVIIIIRLNWIQDTICHRHTWFKRLVCPSHRPSRHTAPKLSFSAPLQGSDLSPPLPPHSLLQSYSSLA